MAEAQALLVELRQAGFTLAPMLGGKLHVRPASKLTDELRAAIRQHKTELLALLDQPPVCGPCGRPQHHPDVVCPNPPAPNPRYPVAPGFEGTEPTAWDEALADAWIAVTLERISRLHDELALDSDIDTPEWERRAAVVNAAYLTQSRRGLRDALDEYEAFARSAFEAWRQERRAA